MGDISTVSLPGTIVLGRDVVSPLSVVTRGSAAPAFTPSSIAGLVGWFDATQIRPASVDPVSLSGGAPAAWFKADDISGNDGDPIGSWSDASAGGHSLTAAGGARPTLKTGILNGHKVARFNGSSHSLSGDAPLAALFAGGTSLSYYIVSMTNVQTTIQVSINWNVTGGTGGYSLTMGYDDLSARNYHIGRRLNADTIAETVGPTNANGQYRAFYASDAPAAANGLATYYDGTLHAITSHFSNGVFGTGSGTFRLGSTGTPDQWLNGDIAEVIVFTRVLSTLERRQVDRYLSDKYALAGVPSSDADLVTDWIDLSGQLNHLNQGGNQRPLYKTAIQNGLPVVRFDGTNDQIKSGTVTTINDPLSVFVVGQRAATGTAMTYFDGGNTAGFVRGTTATPKYKIWNGASAVGTSDTAWHQLSAIANGANDALYVDGALITGPAAIGAPSLTTFSIGADTGAGGNYFNGDIAEVLVYNSALGTTDRQSVEAYLKAKWGTP